MSLQGQHIVVIGAGIAGLSATYALLQRGISGVTVIDEEPAIFSRSSGLNAAIFRPLEADQLLAQLAADSLELIRDLEHEHAVALINQSGLLMLGDHDRLDLMLKNAQHVGIHAEHISSEGSAQLVPGLQVNRRTSGLVSTSGGVLDPHQIGQVLLKSTRRLGAQIRLNTSVKRVVTSQGRCTGVELESGELIDSDAVVLSAGATTGRLALDLAAPLPLLPLQRHLAILEPQHKLETTVPVVWRLDPEIYFRPESGGVLVSPCDETPSADGQVRADLGALSILPERFASLYPALSHARVRRYWACIRAKAPDNRPIIGQAPSVPGLFYLAGLGGFGMSCGLACGTWLAESVIDGKEHPDLGPARLYLPQ